MTNEETYKKIEAEKLELQNEIQEVLKDPFYFKNEDFEQFLQHKVIPYVWLVQFPEHFLNCYVTTDEYDTNNCNGYTWYVKILNARFNHKLFKTDGYSIRVDREAAFKRMWELVEEALETDNIIMWAINHFS